MTRRDALVSACYTAGAVVLGAVPDLRVEWFTRPGVDPFAGSLAAALLLGALHLFRFRRVVLVTVTGAAVLGAEALVFGVTSVGALLIACDLVYTAVIARRRSRSSGFLKVLAACLLALVLTGFVLAPRLPAALVQSLTVVIAFGVSIWWASSVSAPLSRADRERERADRIQQEAQARQREVVANERVEISRELHDVISGHLAAIAMHSAAALHHDAPPAGPVRDYLGQIRSSSLAALRDMRELIEVLRVGRPSQGATPHRWEDHRALVREARLSGVDVTVVDDGFDPAVLSPSASMAAFHVVREGLDNAKKHAPGAAVQVSVTGKADEIRIEVANPVREKPSPVGTGFGLVGLGERVRLSGGSMRALAENGSWRLQAVLPVARSLEAPA